MNAKRGFYNAIFGLLSQIIMIALGIIIPRLVIVNLGSESKIHQLQNSNVCSI